MGKRFQLRICRVIASTLQSCRSKNPSNLPQDPVPSLHPSSSSSAAFIQPPEFKWQKEDNWHVVAKIPPPRNKLHADDDHLAVAFASPPPENIRRRSKKKKKKMKNRNIPTRIRMSTSSADSGWFSSECGDKDETETLVSSSNSSELQRIGERQGGKRGTSTKSKKRWEEAEEEGEGEIPARLSMFKKLIPCTVEGKVKESFAIVKRSEDPYEDFKKSMMDMIVEKQMFEHKDLEQLLQCFLSLNSRTYHAVIVQAFAEIWAAMFSSKPLRHHHRAASALPPSF